MCINLGDSWHSGKAGILLGGASVRLKWTGMEVCLVLHCSVFKGCRSGTACIIIHKGGKKEEAFHAEYFCKNIAVVLLFCFPEGVNVIHTDHVINLKPPSLHSDHIFYSRGPPCSGSFQPASSRLFLNWAPPLLSITCYVKCCPIPVLQ